MCHIINLACQDALDFIDPIVTKVCKFHVFLLLTNLVIAFFKFRFGIWHLQSSVLLKGLRCLMRQLQLLMQL